MFTEIKYLKNAGLLVEAGGKLDIYNAADYLEEIKKNISFTKELILDFSQINYIASIGLRVIHETTGFDCFLNIEIKTDDK